MPQVEEVTPKGQAFPLDLLFKGRYKLIWTAANKEKKRPAIEEFRSVNVSDACNILAKDYRRKKISFELACKLMLGTARIFRDQVDHYYDMYQDRMLEYHQRVEKELRERAKTDKPRKKKIKRQTYSSDEDSDDNGRPGPPRASRTRIVSKLPRPPDKLPKVKAQEMMDVSPQLPCDDEIPPIVVDPPALVPRLSMEDIAEALREVERDYIPGDGIPGTIAVPLPSPQPADVPGMELIPPIPLPVDNLPLPHAVPPLSPVDGLPALPPPEQPGLPGDDETPPIPGPEAAPEIDNAQQVITGPRRMIQVDRTMLTEPPRIAPPFRVLAEEIISPEPFDEPVNVAWNRINEIIHGHDNTRYERGPPDMTLEFPELVPSPEPVSVSEPTEPQPEVTVTDVSDRQMRTSPRDEQLPVVQTIEPMVVEPVIGPTSPPGPELPITVHPPAELEMPVDFPGPPDVPPIEPSVDPRRKPSHGSDEDTRPTSPSDAASDKVPDRSKPFFKKLRDIIKKLAPNEKILFSDICPPGVSTKQEAAATFSVLLDWEGKYVHLDQTEAYGPITITKIRKRTQSADSGLQTRKQKKSQM